MITLTWCNARRLGRMRRMVSVGSQGLLVVAGIQLAAILGACGGSASKAVTVDQAPPPAPVDTLASRVFDFSQDTVLSPLVADWPRAESQGERAGSRQADTADETSEMVYRVQLYTTKDLGTAQAVSKEAKADFGQDVQIDYETPYYKVRVGVFASPQAAEPLLAEARSHGYTGAWAVRVRASEQAP